MDNVAFDVGRIDGLLREIDQCQRPGAAIGIAIEGQPVYRKGFGLANIELPVLLSPSMRLRIGSTTKHFACLAYLLLCEEGRAGIDDPLGRHLPEVHPVARAVTMRQLMSNTSGLCDALDICWQFSGTGRGVTTADILSLYRDIDVVNAPPGTAWIYNNGAWVLLSVAIERITGQPLEGVLRERVFQPLGMVDTLLRRWDTDFVANSATLHMTTADGASFEKSYIGTEGTGEGGMVSTVDDMLLWLAHMDKPSVGSAQTWDAMKASQILANGTSTGYGLGLMLGSYRGVATIGHSGGVMGGNAQMIKVPSASLDIVILVNRHDVSAVELAERVMEICLEGVAPGRSVAAVPLVAGAFRSRASDRIVSLFGRSGRQFVAIDGYEMPAEPDADGVFWPTGMFSYMKQGVRVLAHGEALELSDFGSQDRLEVVGRDASSDSVDGCYRSASTRTELRITGSALYATGKFGSVRYSLERLAPGVWQAKSGSAMPWGGVLVFDSDYRQFRFSNNWRTRGLPFQRCA